MDERSRRPAADQGDGLRHQEVQGHQDRLLRIYSWDREKRTKVEIYFDPTDLKKVKEEIDESNAAPGRSSPAPTMEPCHDTCL